MSVELGAPYPWHGPMWGRLQSGWRSGRLPHALIFHGMPGVGKRAFAEAFAASVLCRNSDDKGRPCGICGECQLMAAGTHPDITRVEILEDKKEIGIDQIRELREVVTLRSHRAGFKVVIVDPADAMNVNSSNALLKTLEEPSGDTLLILLTARFGALLPTVRSRCQAVAFPTPAAADAEAWLRGVLDRPDDAPALLALADGAPLKAQYLAGQDALPMAAGLIRELEALATGKSDPLAVAERWAKSDIPTTLSWVGGVLYDLARLKFGGVPSLINIVSRTSPLHDFASRTDPGPLFEMIDRVREAQRDALTSLNQQMILEGMLLHWNERFTNMNKRAKS